MIEKRILSSSILPDIIATQTSTPAPVTTLANHTIVITTKENAEAITSIAANSTVPLFFDVTKLVSTTTTNEIRNPIYASIATVSTTPLFSVSPLTTVTNENPISTTTSMTPSSTVLPFGTSSTITTVENPTLISTPGQISSVSSIAVTQENLTSTHITPLSNTVTARDTLSTSSTILPLGIGTNSTLSSMVTTAAIVPASTPFMSFGSTPMITTAPSIPILTKFLSHQSGSFTVTSTNSTSSTGTSTTINPPLSVSSTTLSSIATNTITTSFSTSVAYSIPSSSTFTTATATATMASPPFQFGTGGFSFLPTSAVAAATTTTATVTMASPPFQFGTGGFSFLPTSAVAAATTTTATVTMASPPFQFGTGGFSFSPASAAAATTTTAPPFQLGTGGFSFSPVSTTTQSHFPFRVGADNPPGPLSAVFNFSTSTNTTAPFGQRSVFETKSTSTEKLPVSTLTFSFPGSSHLPHTFGSGSISNVTTNIPVLTASINSTDSFRFTSQSSAQPSLNSNPSGLPFGGQASTINFSGIAAASNNSLPFQLSGTTSTSITDNPFSTPVPSGSDVHNSKYKLTLSYLNLSTSFCCLSFSVLVLSVFLIVIH